MRKAVVDDLFAAPQVVGKGLEKGSIPQGAGEFLGMVHLDVRNHDPGQPADLRLVDRRADLLLFVLRGRRWRVSRQNPPDRRRELLAADVALDKLVGAKEMA